MIWKQALTIKKLAYDFLILCAIVIAGVLSGWIHPPSPDMKWAFYGGLIVCTVLGWALLEISMHVVSKVTFQSK